MGLMRGCIALGEAGVSPTPNTQSLRTKAVRDDIIATGTTCVRLWALWNRCQPSAPAAGATVADNWAAIAATADAQALDQEIAWARSMGLVVVLTSQGSPSWANGTTGYTNTTAAEDRFGSKAAYDAYVAGTGSTGKSLQYRFPTSWSTSSPWGIWMAYLCCRYGALQPDPNLRVDYLEPLNEPNYQMWPQQQASTTGNIWDPGANTSVCTSAQMIQTAQSMQAFWSGPVLLVPAASDTDDSTTRYRTLGTTFESSMMSQLVTNGFVPNARVGWSKHNYADMKHGSFGDAVNLAWTASLVHGSGGYWTGYPLGVPASSEVLVTEGGWVRHGSMPDYDQEQRMISSAVAATGVSKVTMFAQYLITSSTGYDSGLRSPFGGAYLSYVAWQALHTGVSGGFPQCLV